MREERKKEEKKKRMHRNILERNRIWEEGIIRTYEWCMHIHIRVPNDDSMMLARYEKERGVL
jgi:hypothetical protein